MPLSAAGNPGEPGVHARVDDRLDDLGAADADIAADLTAQISAVTAMLTSDIGVVYRGIIAETQADPRLAVAIRDTIVEPRAEQCRRRLDSVLRPRGSGQDAR